MIRDGSHIGVVGTARNGFTQQGGGGPLREGGWDPASTQVSKDRQWKAVRVGCSQWEPQKLIESEEVRARPWH